MNTLDPIKAVKQHKRSRWWSALWPESLLGRIVRVFLVMAVWIVVSAAWSHQTVLSLWRHGGDANIGWEPESGMPMPEWIGELQYNWSQLVADPVVEWLSDRWDVSDWTLAGDGAIESVDLSETDIDHTWLPQLRRCVNLVGIRLKSSQLGPEVVALKSLSKLQRITLDADGDRVDVRPLASLPHLQSLNIYSIKRPIVGAESLSSDCKVTAFIKRLDDGVRILDSLANVSCLELTLEEKGEIPTEVCHRIGSMANVKWVSFYSGTPNIAGLRAILRNNSLKTVSVYETTEQWIDDLIDDDQISLILKDHPTLERLEIWEEPPKYWGCFSAPPSRLTIAPKIIVTYPRESRMANFSIADALFPENQLSPDLLPIPRI